MGNDDGRAALLVPIKTNPMLRNGTKRQSRGGASPVAGHGSVQNVSSPAQRLVAGHGLATGRVWLEQMAYADLC